MSDSRENVKTRIRAKLASGRVTRAAAIRIYCIECCCYQPSEVAKCHSVNCPLYRYRMGREVAEGKD